MFKHLFRDLFNTKTEKQLINDYLSDSVNLVDLENRLRTIDRGQAPWQVQASQNLKGWT